MPIGDLPGAGSSGPPEGIHLDSENTLLACATAIGFGDAMLNSMVEPGSRPMLAMWMQGARLVPDQVDDEVTFNAVVHELNLALPWWMLADLAGMIKAAYVRMPVDVRDQWDRRRADAYRSYDGALGKLIFRDGGWVPE